MAPGTVTITSEVLPFAEAFKKSGLSVKGLADQAGVCTSVIYRLFKPTDGIGINRDSAERIARALNTRSNKIDWGRSISDTGRSPGTGVRLTKRQQPRENTNMCPVHSKVLPLTNVCDDCAY